MYLLFGFGRVEKNVKNFLPQKVREYFCRQNQQKGKTCLKGRKAFIMYFSRMTKIAKCTFDPIYGIPLVKVILSKNQFTFKQNNISDSLVAMIDTGAFLCFCKKSILEKLVLTKTGNKERVYMVSDGSTKEIETFSCAIYLEGNGILDNIQVGEMSDAFKYDFIIGTQLLDQFKFIYSPKESIISLEHIG